MDTGTRLKLVRERNNLSQRELARRSGLTNSTISQIEQNRVSPSVSSLKAARRHPHVPGGILQLR